MKRLFYAIAALLAFAGNAKAEWTTPDPLKYVATTVETGGKYLLYNVGYGKFINAGEAWGSQVIVGEETDMEITMTQASDGSWGIKSNYRDQYFKRTTTDSKIGSGVCSIFHDGGTNCGYYWNLSATGNDNQWTIQATDYTDGYFGCDSVNITSNFTTQTLGVYYSVTTAGQIYWKFIDYEAYSEALNTYKQALALGTLLSDNASAGFDFTEEKAVYNNTASTYDEIAAAIKSVNKKLSTNVTVDNPQAITVTNGTIDDGNKGWSWTTTVEPSQKWYKDETPFSDSGFGDFDSTFPWLQLWTGPNDSYSSITGEVYQEIEGLAPGMYILTATVFAYNQKEEKSNKGVYLMGNDELIDAGANPPATRNLYVTLDESEDSLHIGIKISDGQNNNWVGFDNVTLNYYGQTLEAYKLPITNTASTWMSDFAINSENGITQSYVETVNNLYSEGANATTKEEAIAAWKSIKDAIEVVEYNTELYDSLVQAYNAADASGYSYQPLADAMAQAEEMVSAQTSTNEELKSAIDDIYAKIEEAKKNSIEPGSDASGFIYNNDFTLDKNPDGTTAVKGGFGGWTLELEGGAAGNDYTLAETWDAISKVYQTVNGVKPGVYKITVQAYHRTPAGAADAYTAYSTGTQVDEDCAILFANSAYTGIANVFSARLSESLGGATFTDTDNGITPYDKTAANKWFEAGYYTNTLNVIVTADSTLTIGFETKTYCWLVWDAITMTYLGSDAATIKEALDATVKQAQEFAERTMYSGTKEELNTAISNATGASSTDGDALLATYSALTQAMENATVSVETYSDLKEAIDKLNSWLEVYTDNETAVENGENIADEVTSGYKAGSYDDATAEQKKKEVLAAANALRYSGNASDENPEDVTWLIVNPKFADGDEGWTDDNGGNVKVNYQTSEGYNNNFDIYQIIEGLENGTYALTCNAFYRYGAPTTALAAELNGTTVINSELYANDNAIKVQNIWDYTNVTPATDGTQWDGEFTAYTDANGNTTGYVPFTQQGAASFFAQYIDGDESKGTYYSEDTVYVTVTDGTLRIGIRNQNSVDSDWTCFTNFQLYYLGTDSSKDPSGIESLGTNTEVAARKIYTLDGKQVSQTVKGVNIIQEISKSGKTTVKKIIVK